jgi:hypothetical protein
MNKLLLVLIFVFVFAANSDAADYYLSPSGSDSNDGSIESPWLSLNYALSKYENGGTNPRVLPGDTLYLRGGVHDITAMAGFVGGEHDGKQLIVLNTTIGSDTTTIKSYPGEWAILDGDETKWALELDNDMHNVLFENFEIRNCFRYGFRFGDGIEDRFVYSSTFRNLYFHDNTSIDVNDNPAGMQISGDSCIIEYCTFKDNGTVESTHHNNANLILFNDYDSYPESDPRKSNIVRYCVFDGAGSGIKDKGDSNFVDSSDPNTDNEAWANDIHHNVFINSIGRGYYSAQDFVKFHHNIMLDGRQGILLEGSGDAGKSRWYNEVYNNTFVNLTEFSIAIANSVDGTLVGDYGHEVHSNITHGSYADAFLFWTGQSANDFVVTSDYNFWHNSVATVGRKQLDSSANLTTWRGYGYGTNSGLGAVSFVDADNDDYQLDNGSTGENGAEDSGDAGAFDDSNWYPLAGYSAQSPTHVGISGTASFH